MKKYYRKILQYLCKRELKIISDKFPNTLNELIQWHDFMAMECVNGETKGKDRMLGICTQTSNELEKLITNRGKK